MDGLPEATAGWCNMCALRIQYTFKLRQYGKLRAAIYTAGNFQHNKRARWFCQFASRRLRCRLGVARPMGRQHHVVEHTL